MRVRDTTERGEEKVLLPRQKLDALTEESHHGAIWMKRRPQVAETQQVWNIPYRPIPLPTKGEKQVIPPHHLVKAEPTAASLTVEELRQRWELPLAPSLVAYLEETQGALSVQGPFTLHGAAKLSAAAMELPAWKKAFPEVPCPAIALGGDGFGYEFWVSLQDGQVISVHHDEIDEVLASLTLSNDPNEAMQQILRRTASLNLEMLLHLQLALYENDNYEGERFFAIADALGWDLDDLTERLEHRPLMFLWIRVRDFLESTSPKERQKVQELRQAFLANDGSLARKRSLDLGNAWLRDWPDDIEGFKGVQKLDLSNNPALPWPSVWESLPQLSKLKELNLSHCELPEFPEALLHCKSLNRLVLTGNYNIASLPNLSALSKLAWLDVRHTGIQNEEQVVSLQEALPECTALYSQTDNPHTLQRARANKQKATHVIERAVYSDESTYWKSVPVDLKQLQSLEVLDLEGQTNIHVRDLLPSLEGKPIRELRLAAVQGEDFQEIEPFLAFPTLESLDLRLRGYDAIKAPEALELASRLPNLRELRCTATNDWNTSIPETSLEELHLTNLPYNETLPSGLSRQKQLHTLLLSGNLSYAPEELANLPSLRHIVVDTSLEENLKVFARMEALEIYEDRRTHSRELPPIEALPQLKKILLQHGALTNHPFPSLHQLSQLEELVFERTDIYGGPLQGLEGLSNLRKFVLSGSGNQQRGLSPELWQHWPLLEELELWETQPDILRGVGVLQNLRSLRLRDVPLPTSIAEDMLACSPLESLSMEISGLKGWPKALARHSTLRELGVSLSREMDVSKGSEALASLHQLETLNLGGTESIYIPEEIATLPNLKQVNLEFSEKLVLPQVFRVLGECPQLREVEFRWATLGDIPIEVERLTQVERLSFHQSRVTSLPEELMNLTNLRELVLSFNPLSNAECKRFRKKMPWCEVMY